MTVTYHKRHQVPTGADGKIYVVGVLHHDEDYKKRRSRTWGWFSKFEDAEKCVLFNQTDIFEANYYEYAVIECHPEGVCRGATETYWYHVEYAENDHHEPLRVETIDPPEWARNTINWTIG